MPAAMEEAMNPQQHQTRLFLFAAIVYATIASGCGTRFEPVPPTSAECPNVGDPLTGRWIGTWQSFDHGSNRSVQADFTACGGGQYRGSYAVPYGGVIPCTHELTHSAEEHGNKLRFSGTLTRDALLKAGTRYDACSDGATLVINYQSGIDFGVIRLRRTVAVPKRDVSLALADAIGNLGG
jgi:hypothetical protein